MNNPDASYPESIRQISRKAIIYGVSSLGLFVLAIVIVSAFTDVGKVWSSVRAVPTFAVLEALALALVNYAARSVRFQYFARCLGLKAPFREILIYYVAGFAMTMSPGKLGEMTRVWFLKRHYKLPYHKGLALQIGDRASDLYANLLLCLIGTIGFESYRNVVFLMIVGFVIFSSLLVWPSQIIRIIRFAYGLVQIKPRLFIRLTHMIDNLSYMFQPKVFIWSFILGFVGWFSECYALYVIVNALGGQFTVLEAMFTFTFANIAGGLTLLPGGLGGVELTMFGLLTLNKVSPEIATAATVIIRFCTLWFGVGVGFLDLPFAIRLSNASKRLSRRTS